MVQTPLYQKFYFCFGTNGKLALLAINMEDRQELDEFDLNEPDEDPGATDHVSGTAVELEKLLSVGKTTEFFAAIGVERSFRK